MRMKTAPLYGGCLEDDMQTFLPYHTFRESADARGSHRNALIEGWG
jgi:hypothetical protein